MQSLVGLFEFKRHVLFSIFHRLPANSHSTTRALCSPEKGHLHVICHAAAIGPAVLHAPSPHPLPASPNKKSRKRQSGAGIRRSPVTTRSLQLRNHPRADGHENGKNGVSGRRPSCLLKGASSPNFASAIQIAHESELVVELGPSFFTD